jgi:hypothetical protein
MAAMILMVVLGIAIARQFNSVKPKAEASSLPAVTRPVFGEAPNEAERARVEAAPQAEVSEEPAESRLQPGLAAPKEPQEEAGGEAPADVLGFIEKWRKSLATGDIDTQVSCYAPRVQKFFRERNVNRDQVRREKERLMRAYPKISRYDVRDLRLESISGNRAVVTFTKNWDAYGATRFAGSERQRLTLQKYGSGWVIVAEEELKVYWVKRG